jgi:tetratricopeptide (TPR) repeat protein
MTAREPAVPWLTWPVIVALSAIIFVCFVLPALWYCFSRVFRVFTRLEYHVANENWLEAQRTLSEARVLAATGDELQWSHELDCFDYEGQILTAFGHRSAAIEAWQKAIALARKHNQAVPLRTVGVCLANAYEQSGRWAELDQLLPELMLSWKQAGNNGRSQLGRLEEQRERMPMEFRKSPQYKDRDFDRFRPLENV